MANKDLSVPGRGVKTQPTSLFWSFMKKRRGLLIIVLGVSFLILMTVIGTLLDTLIPRRPTSPVQTAQGGSYQVTLQVSPNPPRLTQPATLILQVVHRDTQQPVAHAHISIENSMETMDMGTDRVEAQAQPDGSYIAHAQFTMSGPWQVRVVVAVSGAKNASVTFEVTAQ